MYWNKHITDLNLSAVKPTGKRQKPKGPHSNRKDHVNPMLPPLTRHMHRTTVVLTRDYVGPQLDEERPRP
jgi:hypothetical protein